ncbi:MAG: glycoside hydrolase family 57 protein [Candidatus Saccharibacteria bacterium]
MEKGLLCLVLHAHLPYVRHMEDEEYLEERWFYEAVTETYVPMIHILDKLVEENVDFRITISLSPPLMSMMMDQVVMGKYKRHLEGLIELSSREVKRTEYMPEFNYTARLYHDRYCRIYDTVFNYHHGDLLNAFRHLFNSGKVELITCCATHGFLPLIGIQDEIVRAQVAVAVDVFRRVFGRRPKGIWLPECGYKPGHDYILKEFGIRYFFMDTHGVLYSSKRPKYGVFAPIYCPSGVAAFGRDTETSKQVWSSQEGYPGDEDYREFYRDIGYDLDWDYIKEFLPENMRVDTGIKYFRITGRTEWKEPYQPDWAMEKAALHAGNFMFNRENQLEYLAQFMDRKPLIIAPYDAELFGHWWFEGPDFLNFFFRKTAYDQDKFRLVTPSEYLEMYPVNQVAVPNPSSWGHKGYNEVWLEKSNEWIYRHLHKSGERMVDIANGNGESHDIKRRTLNQAARELLLAQSSDWAFIMKSGTMVDYAVRRTKEHLHNFNRLYYSVSEDRYDDWFLGQLEHRNNIFPDIDYHVFASGYRGTA